MFKIFFILILPISIASIFFFFSEIPWYIDTANTKYQKPESNYGRNWWDSFVYFSSCFFVMMIYVINRFKKVFSARWRWIQILIRNGIINGSPDILPKPIQMGYYENDPVGMKNNLEDFFHHLNTFSVLRQLPFSMIN